MLLAFDNFVPSSVGSVSSLQTTSHYLIGNVETTVEGNALPGKLPETPLRAEPPSSYKVNLMLSALFMWCYHRQLQLR